MKRDGARNWQIHNELHVFDAINSYATFFTNRAYAGYIKCGDMLVPNAHPAYIQPSEFERIQGLRRILPANRRAANGDPEHSKRHQSPFLLSGILFCVCGYAMSGQNYAGVQYYKCGRKHRWGSKSCDSRSIVAWRVNELVTDWLCDNVLTLDQLRQDRAAINARLDGDRVVLESRHHQITDELRNLDAGVNNLLDAIEKTGLTPEIQTRLSKRQTQAREMQAELAQLEIRLRAPRVGLSDEVLTYIAKNLKDELRGESFEETQALLRQVVVRVELNSRTNEMTISYVSPLAETSKTVITPVPPRQSILIPSFLIPPKIAELPFPRPPRGRASKRHHRICYENFLTIRYSAQTKNARLF